MMLMLTQHDYDVMMMMMMMMMTHAPIVQEEANSASEVRRWAEEQSTLLRIASENIKSQLRSGSKTDIGQGILEGARQKYQNARQDFEGSSNLQSRWSAEATRYLLLANEDMRELWAYFDKRFTDVDIT